jgi:hypothetical protein
MRVIFIIFCLLRPCIIRCKPCVCHSLKGEGVHHDDLWWLKRVGDLLHDIKTWHVDCEFSSYEMHDVHGNITDEFQKYIYCLLLMKEHKIRIGPDKLVKKLWRILTAPTGYLHPIICDTPVLLAVALVGTQSQRLEINSCVERMRQAGNFARNLRC